LETLYFSGAHRFLSYFYEGVGAILTLHHVRPERDDAFHPNRILEITPEFLEAMIGELRRMDIDLISLDEMVLRLKHGRIGRRFACITFDDGYRDNKQFAYPILKAHNVPFTIYVPSSFITRSGELWWLALEAVIAAQDEVALDMAGTHKVFSCRTTGEKDAAFAEIYWWLRGLASDIEIRNAMRRLSDRYGVDVRGFCDALCMTWGELAELAGDPLVTIGAHTVNHPILAKTPTHVALAEIADGAAAIAQRLGKRPQHFSFPFGDPTSAGPREFALAAELGFRTAVTTRPGVLFAKHRDRLMALPRISINGDYQKLRYVDVLLSGAATAAWSGFRRGDAA
jgi:peptidoglycan/xylan/chitin deacetylase (PgdA/CDA1 family)